MKIGVSKVDITPDVLGVTMLGYGVPHHTVEGISTRIFARGFFIQSENKAVAIVVAEIAFITPALRYKVLELLAEQYSHLQLNEHNILLCAQHTHSAPGGYSYHPMYNITTPGLRQDILKKYTDGIVDAIVLAAQKTTPGNIKLGKGSIDESENVSFNRSIEAYNKNKDVTPITQVTSQKGVNREMTLLQFVDENGTVLGSINWFAVHPTSIPNTLNKIHSDNKGYAALYLEEEHRRQNPDYVGAFAQGNAGDVTPNFVYDKTKKFNRFWNGPYAEHDRNALYNGRIQYVKAKEIENELATKSANIGDGLDTYLIWKDMSGMDIDPKFTDGVTGAVTSPSCMGVAMFMGTRTEGLGFPYAVIPLAKTLSLGVKNYELGVLQHINKKESIRLKRKYKAQGPKEIIMETGENRLFGTKDIKHFILPDIADKTIEWIKHFDRKGAYDILPMAPQVMPFQIIRIGEVAIVSIPFEITTVAGRRLQKMLETELLNDVIKSVILSPYSNAFNGYITTFEEYQVQEYEGGHTVFGQWTLAATMQICHELAQQFKKSPENRNFPSDKIQYPTKSQLSILEY
jgi:neutral ceramidase